MHSSHFPSRLEPTHQTRIRWSPTHFTTDFPSKPEPGARANAAMPRLITVMIMWCHFLWWWYQFVRRQFLWRQFLGCVIILARSMRGSQLGRFARSAVRCGISLARGMRGRWVTTRRAAVPRAITSQRLSRQPAGTYTLVQMTITRGSRSWASAAARAV